MTLDEAIEHAKEQAQIIKCKACAEEHQQLADWLEELKIRRIIEKRRQKEDSLSSKIIANLTPEQKAEADRIIKKITD